VLEDTLAAVRAWWSGEGPDQRVPDAIVRPVQDPLEVWLGGRGPKALERVGRVADGWLGALVDPGEARAGRLAIQQSAERAGRVFDPEHFGISIAYAREALTDAQSLILRARRQDVDPLPLLPVGADALRTLLNQYLDAGLSKFVLRPTVTPSTWTEELAWLADAVLDMQN